MIAKTSCSQVKKCWRRWMSFEVVNTISPQNKKIRSLSLLMTTNVSSGPTSTNSSSWIQDRLTWETNKGTDRATGVVAEWQGAWQSDRGGDRGGLAKWGKMNKTSLLTYYYKQPNYYKPFLKWRLVEEQSVARVKSVLWLGLPFTFIMFSQIL